MGSGSVGNPELRSGPLLLGVSVVLDALCGTLLPSVELIHSTFGPTLKCQGPLRRG